jgi:hypothetical protein
MQSIKLHSHVGEDGILQLEVPVGLTNMDLEVTVTAAPVQPEEEVKTPVELGWTPGFFERTFGAWEGEPLVRGEQGKSEQQGLL